MIIKITKKHLIFIAIFLVIGLGSFVVARGGYITNSGGATYGSNQSGTYIQAEDIIIEDAIVAVNNDVYLVGNFNVSGNLYVEGCIKYTTGGSGATLGVCN